MTEQSTDTKVKIMDVARVLFATQGFEGTSIREIAKEAEVNIASVNYHFASKENLFLEIMRTGYQDCSLEMKTFYQQNNPDLETTLLHLFRHFLSRSHDLRTHFKMLMSAQHNHHLASQGTEDERFGPPGGKVIIDALIKEVGGELIEEDLHWAIKTLFSHVIHNALMYACCFKDNKVPYTSVEDLEKNIKRLSRVVVRELKSK